MALGKKAKAVNLGQDQKREDDCHGVPCEQRRTSWKQVREAVHAGSDQASVGEDASSAGCRYLTVHQNGRNLPVEPFEEIRRHFRSLSSRQEHWVVGIMLSYAIDLGST